MLTKENLWVAGGEASSTHQILTSGDGITWTGSTSGDFVFDGGQCLEVAYNNLPGSDGLWVAGGGYTTNNNNIAYSSDGVSWTGSSVFYNDVCNALAHNGLINGGLWVAGGSGNNNLKLAYSSNGISWIGSTSGDEKLSGICKTVASNRLGGGNGLWVAGGDGTPHTLITSGDGINWTGSTSGDLAFTGGACRAVAYNGLQGGNGLWIAAGGGFFGSTYTSHYIVYSSDGLSWTGSASGDLVFTGYASTCLAVAHNGILGSNGLWVAGGDILSPNKIAYSSDGISWTGSTSGNSVIGEFGACRSVAYSGQQGLWIAGGGNGSTNQISYSKDGITWTGSTSGNLGFFGGFCDTVAFGKTNVITPDLTTPSSYIYQVANSSFNNFSTNFRGMANIGEY
jgi:hypothetical protein